jgi:AAA family ATP:ADP antiporter
MALLLTLIFTKMSNKYSQEKVMYLLISGFLAFFTVYATVLYPMREQLHPHELAENLLQLFPNFKWMIIVFENWVFTTFYVISELWGVIVLQVLFWGFANEVTRINEAGRFYSVFAIGSNIAAALAGLCAILFMSSEDFFGLSSPFATAEETWENGFTVLLGIIIVSGLMIMAIFYWMNKNVLNKPAFEDLHSTKRSVKMKKKLSLWESFSYLSNSKYLICIAMIVVGYNLVINLVEVVWKDQLRQLYPSKGGYMQYMSYLTLIMGIVSTVTAVFMANIIKRFGWTKTAMITPTIMLLTSAGFFIFMFFREYLGDIVVAFVGTTPLAITVFFGAAQNCLSKAAKYSVFDATQNMAYIPLSHESKLKGKAAIDGVGSRLGKSGSSLIHTGLLMIFDTLTRSSPYIAVILLVVIVCWIISIKSLGHQFNALVASKPSDDIVEDNVIESAPSGELQAALAK